MRRWIALALVLVSVAIGCGDGDSRLEYSRATAPPAAPTADVAEKGAAGEARAAVLQSPSDQAAQRGTQVLPARDSAPAMIIRTGNASIEVDSLEPAVARVRLLAQRVGGYVANTAMQVGREALRSATLELKVPANQFDQTVTGLAPIGRVESVNIRAEDVGEEFVDVTARVGNSRRLEERLLQLLATRTGRLEDVLHVERELARVREEIERYEGRLRYLRTRVATSTLVVTVHEPAPIVGAYRGSSVIGSAFRQAWRNFMNLSAGLIASLGIVLPLTALATLAWLVLRRFNWPRPK